MIFVIYSFWNNVIFWIFLGIFSFSCVPFYIFRINMTSVSIIPISVYDFPLFNTILLITSGFSITWAHRAVAIGSYKESIDSFLLTIFLGFFFVILQAFEYMKQHLIYQIVYMLVHFICLQVCMLPCNSGCNFYNCVFLKILRRHFLMTHYLDLCLLFDIDILLI